MPFVGLVGCFCRFWLLVSFVGYFCRFLVAFVVCWLLLSFIGCLCRLLAAFVAALVVTEHKTPSRAYVYVCV